MRQPPFHRPLLLLVLVASLAVAREHPPVERNLYLSSHPESEAPRVYVAGRTATVLRFEQPCALDGTKMLGWEGRFEPLLVGGKSVVLVPLRDIEPEDRFLLLVTLADGTELPFTVMAREGQADQQVNVFADRKGPEAVLASLYDSLGRERVLREENERYRKAENSVDHALATLLVMGSAEKTPFQRRQTWLLHGDGVEIRVAIFTSKVKDKVAVVFGVKNTDLDEPWSLKEARLWSEAGGDSKPFALRTSRESWGPGGEHGQIAVVMDAHAFDSKNGPERLVLEIFRGDGLREAYVLLDQQLLR